MKTLQNHMKEVHRVRTGNNCEYCPRIFSNERKLKKHKEDHHKDETFYCDICKKVFRHLEEARTHSLKPCGAIKQKEVIIEIEEEDKDHKCNACDISYNNNEDLERHMEENHTVDCSKCNVVFNSQDDMYSHANNCSEVIEPNMCDKCNMELVSKAGLKKHMKRCKGNENTSAKSAPQKSLELCNNGPQCRFKKMNKCLFKHVEKQHQTNRHQHVHENQEQPWTTARNRGRRGGGEKQLYCNKCEMKYNNQNEKEKHMCEQNHNTSVDKRRKNTECNRGPNCFRLKNGTCWFKHSGLSKTSPQGGQRSELWCKWQDKCSNNSCHFRHFGQGFPHGQHARNRQ